MQNAGKSTKTQKKYTSGYLSHMSHHSIENAITANTVHQTNDCIFAWDFFHSWFVLVRVFILVFLKHDIHKIFKVFLIETERFFERYFIEL